MHEEIARGSLSELTARFSSPESARGEMVLMIDRTVMPNETGNQSDATVLALVAEFESNGLDHRAALKKAARELGLSRDEAYRRLASERRDS